MQVNNIILIGGTSHTGKSSLASALAERLGWDMVSTDKLARHPGRPWRTPPDQVPDHVIEHYGGSLTVPELIEDVLRHYKKNVWPQVERMVATQLSKPQREDGLVLEGSALWPDWFRLLDGDGIAGVWLTANPELIRERIYENSSFLTKSAQERRWIDQFLARSLAFDILLREIVDQQDLLSIDVAAIPTLEDQLEICMGMVQPGR